eukprot:XP_011662214.1 PREDICTED: uncharacterized protein LOC105437387 [Strongylocentrotus purpuratus]
MADLGGPWARVAHRCTHATRAGRRCKRTTRHGSRVCWQHRAMMGAEELEQLQHPHRCQAHIRNGLGRQCSRVAKKRYVLPYCRQHYYIHRQIDAWSSDDDL